MSAQSIEQPFPIFTDADGAPLEAGYIWVGVENLNAITDPVAVYWDAALTQPAVQPIRTAGGYPVNAGTPARLYTEAAYSILVQDRNGITVYSSASGNTDIDIILSQWLTVTGSNTILGTSSITLPSYEAGQTFRFVAAATNTGAVTLDVNGLGQKTITKQGTSGLVSGDIVSGCVVNVTYDGTRFQMVAVPNTLALTSLGVSGPSVISQFNSTDNVNVIQVSQASTIGGFIGADSGNLLLANSSGSEILRITSTGVNANTKPAYFCRAWVNFDGASPGSGRGSQNVTSVTRTGLGDYTVNFSTAIADANYCTVVTSTSNSGANAGYYGGIYPGGTYTASAVQVGIHQSGVGFAVDPAVVCVAVFR